MVFKVRFNNWGFYLGLFFVFYLFLFSSKFCEAGNPSLNEDFTSSSNWTPISGSFLNKNNSYNYIDPGENIFKQTTDLFTSDFTSGEPSLTVLNTPFVDTFTQSDGAPLQWTATRGTFNVSNSEFVTTSVSTSLAIPTNTEFQNWSNYRFKARVKNDGAVDSSGYVMLYFRLSVSGANETGYVLRLRQTGVIDVYKRINGSYGSSIASASNIYPKDNNYHDVIITIVNNTFSVWVDKTEAQKPDFTATDSTYTSGTIGFGTTNFNSHIDNIEVELLSQSTPLFTVIRPSFYGGGGQYYSTYTSGRSLSLVADNDSNSWTDYRLKTKIKGLSTPGSSNYAIVYFRTQMIDATHENSYALKFRQNGTLDLDKNENAWTTVTTLKSADVLPQDNDWHDITVVIMNNTVKVWIDKSELLIPDFEYNFLSDYAYGTVGFGTSGGDSVFDDILIENLTSIILTPPYIYTDGNTSIGLRSSVDLDNLLISVVNPAGISHTLDKPIGCLGKKTCTLVFPDDFTDSDVSMLGFYTITVENGSDISVANFVVKEKPLFTFAQITDMHINTTTQYKHITEFITNINEQKNFPLPNFVVTVGDNTNDGTLDQLTYFKTKMDLLNVPYYPIAATHDSSSETGSETGHNWQTIFGSDKFTYSWTVGDFLMLAVDYGTPYGGFGNDINSSSHKSWLQTILSNNLDKKVFLFYHQPLTRIRDDGLAKDYYLESPEVREILESSGNVIAQFAGHAHINANVLLNGISYIDTNSLYGLDKEFRYVEVYSDRLETRIVKLGNIPYDHNTPKWADSTDSNHKTETMYHFGTPEERDFKIDFSKRSSETLFGISLTGNSSWRDYLVQSNIRLGKADYYGENVAGLVFRYTDPNNYYSVILDSNEDIIQLRRKYNGVTTNLESVSTSIDTETNYLLKVVLKNSLIEVYLDGIKKIEKQDDIFTSGKVGIITHLATTTYSNFLVSDRESPQISSVANTSNTISWVTDEESSSKIEFGFTSSYGNTTPETDISTRVTTHSVNIPNLPNCTTYQYRSISKDSQSNEGISENKTFTTSGCVASSEPISTAVSETINYSIGGTLMSLSDQNSVKLLLTIPALFSNSNAVFQSHQLNSSTVIPVILLPTNETHLVGDNLYQLSAFSDIQTTIPSFDNPLTVSMYYNESDVSNFDKSSLSIYRWDDNNWNKLSNCNVNTNSRIVSCTTTQFSTFGLFGKLNNTNTSYSSSPEHVSNNCIDKAPIIPDLFQINVTSTSAKIFFTPSDVNQYYISFSTKLNAEDYGEFISLAKDGVQSHNIYLLKPNTTYYIKVRGHNGCMPGDWSDILTFTTTSSVKKTKIFYKYSKVNLIIQGIKSSVKRLTPSNNTKNKPIPTITPIKTELKPAEVVKNETQIIRKKFCIWKWCF